MRPWRRRFEVDGLRYEFCAAPGEAVTFRYTGGSTRKGTVHRHFFWNDPDDYATDDLGLLTVSAFKVFRVVKGLLLDWVFVEKPYAFYISGTTDRKKAIYEWAMKKLIPVLERDYHAYRIGSGFHFYRKQPTDLSLLPRQIVVRSSASECECLPPASSVQAASYGSQWRSVPDRRPTCSIDIIEGESA